MDHDSIADRIFTNEDLSRPENRINVAMFGGDGTGLVPCLAALGAEHVRQGRCFSADERRTRTA